MVERAKSAEPKFIARARLKRDPATRMAWLQLKVGEAHVAGCTWKRITIHPDDDERVILEAWETRPEDEGEPRWSKGEDHG